MSEPVESKIFISYRRVDSAATCGRIYDRLIARFGRKAVFKDVDSIRGAMEFTDFIMRDILPQCAVQVVLIGPLWLDIQGADGTRRLEHPGDLVRKEIEGALTLGIPILPLLVQGAEEMPPVTRLPESIRGMLRYSALHVRYDPDFEHDMGRVVVAIEPLIETLSPPPPAPGDVAKQLQAQIAASFATHDWPDVERRADLLIRQAPLAATAQIRFMYGSALVALSRPREALPQLRTALALSNDQGERLNILSTYAEVLASLGQWGELLAITGEALRLVPDEPHWQAWQLRSLTELKRPGEALEVAQQLTARTEATAAQWLARARLEMDLARYEDAQHSLAAAQRLAPNDTAVAQAQAELFPTPEVPHRLAELGFHGMSIARTPVILPPVVPVPAGDFLMGSDKRHDAQAAADEMPRHNVTLPAFQIGKFLVTVAEYACFVRAGHSQPENWQSQLARPDHPVVNVTWHDAMAYTAWLVKLTGQPWRLPTEAEWEKAARWDPQWLQARLYPWGDQWDNSRANTSENGIKTTTPVGQYPSGASPWGAQDMAGNVWEWTSSLFKSYPYDPRDGREDQNATGHRVRRGGSWDDDLRLARSAFRLRYVLDYLIYSVGFRLLLAAPAR